MEDTEALSQIHAVPIDKGTFDMSRFGRPTGLADTGEGGSRGDKKAMQESTLTGLRAMLKTETREEVPPIRPTREKPALRSTIKETNPAPKATLLESGDILENTAFKFMVTVQELTEDGGFLGRGAGVGRIRVRGSEMGLYRRVGKGV
jgi:hypothetical protein